LEIMLVMGTDVEVNVFCQVSNELGESPIWHQGRQALFWLDILNRTLFGKKFDGHTATAFKSWKLPEVGSAMALDKARQNILWMVTDRSFGALDLVTGKFERLVELGLAKTMRANDGSVSPHGDFWFGTMEWSPTGIHGGIYSITPTGKLLNQKIPMGIPNTFCWSPDGSTIYISDSLQQKMFSFAVKKGMALVESRQLIADLSGTEATPDGGAVDQQGFLWNAHWNGHKVVKYGPDGRAHEILRLPAPKPTSCCFGGPELRHLFMTSARAGIGDSELEGEPLSGSVFMKEVSVPGKPIIPFSLKI
jgi:sugar lactone lactonase YvrE